jgi:hypothetical protein
VWEEVSDRGLVTGERETDLLSSDSPCREKNSFSSAGLRQTLKKIWRKQLEEKRTRTSGLKPPCCTGRPWPCAFSIEHCGRHMAEGIYRRYHLRGSAARDNDAVDAHARTRRRAAWPLSGRFPGVWSELPFLDRRSRQRASTVSLPWRGAFRNTAVLLALIEAAGLAWCIFVLLAKPSGTVTSGIRSGLPRHTRETDPLGRTDSGPPCS